MDHAKWPLEWATAGQGQNCEAVYQNNWMLGGNTEAWNSKRERSHADRECRMSPKWALSAARKKVRSGQIMKAESFGWRSTGIFLLWATIRQTLWETACLVCLPHIEGFSIFQFFKKSRINIGYSCIVGLCE